MTNGSSGELLLLLNEDINQCVNILVESIRAGQTIWIAGNGGSATTAEHLEIDLLKIRDMELKQKIKVQCLNSNTAVLTAILNDIGSEYIFARQLERKASKGDVLLLISASGSSPNLISAFEVCLREEIRCIGMLGFDGGELGKLLHNQILVRSKKGEYAFVENMHLAICHEISERVYNLIHSK